VRRHAAAAQGSRESAERSLSLTSLESFVSSFVEWLVAQKRSRLASDGEEAGSMVSRMAVVCGSVAERFAFAPSALKLVVLLKRVKRARERMREA
jgi:hypothetical protein